MQKTDRRQRRNRNASLRITRFWPEHVQCTGGSADSIKVRRARLLNHRHRLWYTILKEWPGLEAFRRNPGIHARDQTLSNHRRSLRSDEKQGDPRMRIQGF